MTGTVTDLTTRRRDDDHRPPMTCRDCGGHWFRLDGIGAGLEVTDGAVTLDTDGYVTGYCGTPVCIDCEEDEKTVALRTRYFSVSGSWDPHDWDDAAGRDADGVFPIQVPVPFATLADAREFVRRVAGSPVVVETVSTLIDAGRSRP